jgi:outer membrane protein assembly factor BamB
MPAEEVSGNPLTLASDGRSIFFPTLTHVVEVDARLGKLVRKLSTADCDGRVIDLRLDAGRLYALCEHPPGEGAMVPGHGPARWFGNLCAFERATGKSLWCHEAETSAPVACEASRCWMLDGQAVVALEAASGKPVWRHEVPPPDHLGVVLSAKLVLSVDGEGRLTALQRADGQQAWVRALEGRVFAPPVADGTRVFVGAVRDPGGKAPRARFLALSLEDGHTLWQVELGAQDLFHRAALAGGAVLLATGADEGPGHFYAWEAETGAERWKVPLVTDANGHVFEPTVSGEQVFVWDGSEDLAAPDRYRLEARDLATGAVKWSWAPKIADKAVFSRIVAPGERVCFDDLERLICLSPPPEAPRHAPAPKKK